MKVTDFMLNLVNQLVKDKSVAESTAAAYIKALFMLNGKDSFKSLTFLKKTPDIEALIEAYAQNTQKTLYTAVTSVLSLFKDKPAYKKIYDHYYAKMMGKSNEMKEAPANVKSETQQAEWIDWADVLKIHEEQQKKVGEFATQKAISSAQWNTLLNSTILALYTEVQPRRNQDYSDMFVVGKWNDTMDKSKNYLDLAGHQFVFNKYKTAKKHGEQVEEVPAPLQATLKAYLTHHPLSKSKAKEFKLLVKPDGSPLNTINSITRILNRIFGKKIGSSMLRHSYLSSKYGDVVKEMEDDAEAMGHTTGVQRGYIKN
jgi:integrase